MDVLFPFHFSQPLNGEHEGKVVKIVMKELVTKPMKIKIIKELVSRGVKPFPLQIMLDLIPILADRVNYGVTGQSAGKYSIWKWEVKEWKYLPADFLPIVKTRKERREKIHNEAHQLVRTPLSAFATIHSNS